MDTTDLEARLRDWCPADAYLNRIAADALAQQRAEIARLREALVRCIAAPSRTISNYAARQALEPRHD